MRSTLLVAATTSITCKSSHSIWENVKVRKWNIFELRLKIVYQPLQLHWPVSISHVLPMEPTAWQLQAENWKLKILFNFCVVFCLFVWSKNENNILFRKWNFLTHIREKIGNVLSKHKLHIHNTMTEERIGNCLSLDSNEMDQMSRVLCSIWCCQGEKRMRVSYSLFV